MGPATPNIGQQTKLSTPLRLKRLKEPLALERCFGMWSLSLVLSQSASTWIGNDKPFIPHLNKCVCDLEHDLYLNSHRFRF